MKRFFISIIFLTTLVVLPGCGFSGGPRLDAKELKRRVDAAFVKTDCPTVTLEPRSAAVYQGPLIDTHIHVAAIPDGAVEEDTPRPSLGVNTFIQDYICMMDREGTSKVFAFFPVWNPIRDQSIKIVERAMREYPNRFVPFIMPPDRDDRRDGFPTVTAKELSSMLESAPGLFRGFGEIGLYARGDHGGPKGAPALPPDSERLQAIYPVLREHNLIVYFHLGQGQQASFERTLDANPDINFIWHGDQLIPGSRSEQDLSALDEILSRHSNAYYGVDELYGDVWLLRPDISKEKFLAHFEQSEILLKQDLATWKWFIEKHPDQVLFGTDRGGGAQWSLDPDVAVTLNNYTRSFIAGLDPAVQEKFAYKNAERLIGEQ